MIVTMTVEFVIDVPDGTDVQSLTLDLHSGYDCLSVGTTNDASAQIASGADFLTHTTVQVIEGETSEIATKEFYNDDSRQRLSP